LSIVAYTIIWWGKSAYETYRDQTALAPYVVYVKNVKRVGKVTRKEGPGITRLLKITSITLDNGDIILNPTVAKLKKRKLIVEINPWRDESEQNAYSISKRILAKNEK
ncbi:MAG: hypothetical protein ABF915_11205, partial [Schleiferilactobacillus harbinensis]